MNTLKYTKQFAIAMMIRAIRTMAQTALGTFTVGVAMHEVSWRSVVSIALVSAIYSVLTSLATDLPEVKMPTLPDASSKD